VKLAGLDGYGLVARLAPPVLAVAPLAVALVAAFPVESGAARALVPFALLGALAFLISQLARDAGKQAEASLFESWGGAPTRRRLRHRDAANRELLARRHSLLATIAPDLAPPDAAQETVDPKRADRVYDALTAVLRDRTRDAARFPAVASATTIYGFRRNLYGLRGWALGFVMFAIIFAVLAPTADVRDAVRLTFAYDLREPSRARIVLSEFVSIVALLVWITRVTPTWVKEAGDAYAEALVGAVELVATEGSAAGS
jgi:hypothetical protein